MAKLDLGKYGMGYEGVGFVAGKETLTIRQETFKQFIEIIKTVSLKMAYLMTIYMKIISTHKPFIILKIKDLAEELGTDPCVIRKYSKILQKNELIKFEELDKGDSKENHQYIFTMGPKFEKWIWKSNLFEKKKNDFIDIPSSPKQSTMDSPTVHDGLPQESKESITAPQTVHYGPQENPNFESSVGNPDEKNRLSSSPSSLNLSSSPSSGDTKDFEILEIGEEEEWEEEDIKMSKSEIKERYNQLMDDIKKRKVS